MTTAITKKCLSLPDVAKAGGLNLDVLRKRRLELAALGLIEKVGPAWVAQATAVDAIIEQIAKPKGSLKSVV